MGPFERRIADLSLPGAKLGTRNTELPARSRCSWGQALAYPTSLHDVT